MNMKKRGRPPKITISDDLSRQDITSPDTLLPSSKADRRNTAITPEQITADDVTAIEHAVCSRHGMWGQVSPERLIAAVLNVMGGEA